MTASVIERSHPIAIIPRDPDPTTDARETLPAHDVREEGLAAAARSLGMRVADLGPLQIRRAQADLVHCPVCPNHPVRHDRRVPRVSRLIARPSPSTATPIAAAS